MQSLDQTLMAFTLTLMKVSRAYKSAADRMAGDYKLSQATAWPVVMIARLGDGVRPGMVADALGLEPSSVVRLVDHLVEAGLVTRGEDANDRRARTLHLTAEGRRRAAQLEKALASFRRTLFHGIERADVEACLKVLAALDEAIVEYESASEGGSRV